MEYERYYDPFNIPLKLSKRGRFSVSKNYIYIKNKKENAT